MDPGVMLRRLQPASSILTGFRPVLLPSSQVRIAFVRGVAARALEFAILIAARTGEVLGAHWSEIDFGGNRGEVTINARELMVRRASIRAFTLWDVTPAEEADIHAGLIAGLENGTLRPVVGKELPLAEAARAHKEILEPGSTGKIVLIC